MRTRILCFISCLLIIGGTTALAQTWQTNGLIAYYPFNGNSQDASGNGHNAVAMGTGLQLANGISGEPNSAYRGLFAGNTNNLQASGVNLSNSSLSITLWFKKDYVPYTIDHGSILTLGTQSATGKQLHIRPYYSGVQFRFSFFNDDFNVSTPVGNGNWTHIACTYDNVTRERRIYFDGQLIATNIAVQGSTGTSTLLMIPAGLGSAPSGLLDQVRIYNRVLAQSEISELYQYEVGSLGNIASATKALRLNYTNLLVNASYQLKASGDLNTWTNYGLPFTAISDSATQYIDVTDWNTYFQLKPAP